MYDGEFQIRFYHHNAAKFAAFVYDAITLESDCMIYIFFLQDLL